MKGGQVQFSVGSVGFVVGFGMVRKLISIFERLFFGALGASIGYGYVWWLLQFFEEANLSGAASLPGAERFLRNPTFF